MRIQFVGLLVVASASLLSACATRNTINDVPKINPDKIQVPAMSALPKRDLSIQVVDSRTNAQKEQSLELQAEVERATTRALARTGIAVTGMSPNSLTLTISDTASGKFQQGCVKITGALLLPKKAKLGSDATSCYETQTPGGNLISTDVTRAYEEALSLVFKNLDEAMGKMQTM